MGWIVEHALKNAVKFSKMGFNCMPSVSPLQQPSSPDDFTSELTESQPATTRVQKALAQLLDQLLSTPHATGAALALASNEVLICVASRGRCAPPIGTRCSRDE